MTSISKVTSAPAAEAGAWQEDRERNAAIARLATLKQGPNSVFLQTCSQFNASYHSVALRGSVISITVPVQSQFETAGISC